MSAENVVIQALFEGVVPDELAVRLRPGDALAAGRVDGDDSVLGNVEVGRGLGASLGRSSLCAYLLSYIHMNQNTWATITPGIVIRMTATMEGAAAAPIANTVIPDFVETAVWLSVSPRRPETS